MDRVRTLICLVVASLGSACSSLPQQSTQPVPVIAHHEVVTPAKAVEAEDDEPELVANVLPAQPKAVSPVVEVTVAVAVKPVVKAVPKKVATAKPVSKPVIKVAQVKQQPAAPPTVAVAKTEPKATVTAPTVLKQPKKDWRYTVVPEPMKKLFDLATNMVKSLWAEMKMPSFILAKIEQETCISPTSTRCGSTHAELKTNREYGFGYGQTTIAYNKDGTERFNVWKDLRNADPVLKQKWTWENRYDSELQMRAVVVKSKMSHSAIRFPTKNDQERTAFSAVDYNSGSPITDRRLCVAQADCDPSSWFNTQEKKGVEAYSVKSKVAAPGYGKSFFEISREYPKLLLFIRREKYIPFVDPKESGK